MQFFHKDNYQNFNKLVVSFLLVLARHIESTQNSKLVISLQYLKREQMDEVDFLHADKHQTYKLIPLMLLDMAWPVQITQNNKFARSFQYLKWGMKLIFCVMSLTVYCSYNLLYIQCSPTIDPFPVWVCYLYQVFSSFDCLCNISSLLLFKVAIVPRKLFTRNS